MDNLILEGDILTEYQGSEETVMLDYKIKTIGPRAFYNNTTIKSIIIPFADTIDTEAFMGCSNLREVKILSPLISIGKGAFKYCKSLTCIDIPDTVEIIGAEAFMMCESLASINLPDTLTVLNDYTFSECSSLSSIDLPKSLTRIADGVFAGCKSLQFLVIPDSVNSVYGSSLYKQNEFRFLKVLANTKLVKSLSEWHNSVRVIAVDSVDGLTEDFDAYYKGNTFICYKDKNSEYTVPDCITTIGKFAFAGCKSIKSVTLPDTIEKIEDCAFYMSNIDKVFILYGLKSIGSHAFYDSQLTEIFIPDSVSSLGIGVFSDCDILKEVTLSNQLTSIPNNTFYKCIRLGLIDVPESVKIIGEYAFAHSGIIKLIIRGTPESIDEYAFSTKGTTYKESERFRHVEDYDLSFSVPLYLVELKLPKECFNKYKDLFFLESRDLVVIDIDTNEELYSNRGEPLIVDRHANKIPIGGPINRVEKLPYTDIIAKQFVLRKRPLRTVVAPPATPEVIAAIEEVKEELESILHS